MGGFVGDLLGTSKPSTSGQAAATAQVKELQERMYDESVDRSQPFYELGTSGVDALSGLVSGGDLQSRYGMEQFQEDPGYQFRLQEGQKALDRAMAAQGKTLDAEYAKRLGEYNQGMASQEYGNAFDRYRAEDTDMYNRLFNLANIGTGQAAQMQQAGQTMAGNVGNALSAFGQVEDAADIAKNQARSSMFKGAVQAAMMASDSRVKDNIEFVREDNGHKIYHFNYKGDDKRYEGVMAQDVLEYMPDAVIEDDGIYKVNYGMLGLEMTEVN